MLDISRNLAKKIFLHIALPNEMPTVYSLLIANSNRGEFTFYIWGAMKYSYANMGK